MSLGLIPRLLVSLTFATESASTENFAPPRDTQIVWSVPLVHTGGLMVSMRLALWLRYPDDFSPTPWDRRWEQFKSSYSAAPDFRSDRILLESDGDPWTQNIFGHGLFGTESYSRFRRCGSGPLGALLFAASTSAIWEYGPEAFHKQPSAVDLVLTPLLGGALGEGRIQLQRWLQKRPRSWSRRLVEIVVDPLGEAERGWLGTRC